MPKSIPSPAANEPPRPVNGVNWVDVYRIYIIGRCDLSACAPAVLSVQSVLSTQITDDEDAQIIQEVRDNLKAEPGPWGRQWFAGGNRQQEELVRNRATRQLLHTWYIADHGARAMVYAAEKAYRAAARRIDRDEAGASWGYLAACATWCGWIWDVYDTHAAHCAQRIAFRRGSPLSFISLEELRHGGAL